MAGATIGPDSNIFDLQVDAFRKVVDLNLFGTVLPTMVFAHGREHTGAALITNDGWKIRRINHTTELYNIRRDPAEYNELSTQYPAKKTLLEKLLLKECAGNWENGLCQY